MVTLRRSFIGEERGSGETGDWLWRQPANPDQPRDMGYAMGARIVEEFYDNAADKRQAAGEVMAISDYPALLKLSGYRPPSASAAESSG